MQPIEMHPVGIVRTDVTEIDKDWRKTISQIHLNEAYMDGLTGLENWSHLVIIFVMHEATFNADEHLTYRPGGREDIPETGVFAQRSHLSPNLIGMTTVKLQEIDANVLTVRGLDALDGTPVVDIKPHAPLYDGATDPLVPVWFLRLMQS